MIPEDIIALARAGETIEANAYANMINLAPPEVRKDQDCLVLKIDSATLFSIPRVDWMTPNRLIGLGIFEAGTREALDEVVAVCRKVGTPKFYVALCSCAKPDAKSVSQWLAELGFKWHNDWVKMYVRSGEILAVSEASAPLRIEEVGVSEADDFARTVTSGFGYPESYTPWLARPVGKPGWHHFLAYDQSKPVATGALYVEGEVGNLLLGSTLQSHRRLGAQLELLRTRLKLGIDEGCKIFFTETHTEIPGKPNPSYHNMKRLGFKEAYLRPNYVLERAP